MSQKQNLLSYFSPVSRTNGSCSSGQRRTRDSDIVNSINETSPASKRRKSDTTSNEEEKECPKISLSPEQKAMIEVKKQQALAKLKHSGNVGKPLSDLIGETWYKKLQPEFSKDYFVKVKYSNKDNCFPIFL